MTIIKGWRAIAQTFGVTQAVAHGWREQGAPILLLPGGKKETVPAANVPELWAWLSGRYGPAASSPALPPLPLAKEEAHPLPDTYPCPPVSRHAAPDMPQLWNHGHGAAIP